MSEQISENAPVSDSDGLSSPDPSTGTETATEAVTEAARACLTCHARSQRTMDARTMPPR